MNKPSYDSWDEPPSNVFFFKVVFPNKLCIDAWASHSVASTSALIRCRCCPAKREQVHWVPKVSRYPLVNIQKNIEHGPVEMIDLLIKHGDFPVRYVAVYQRVPGLTSINEVVNVVIDADVSLLPIPMGSMYAIYGNVYHPCTPMLAYISYMDPMGYVEKAPDPLWAFSVCTFFTCMLSSRGCGTGSAQMFVQRGGGACWRPLGAERGSGAW